MKKIILLCIMSLVCSIGIQAQTDKKELTKKEKKEAQAALDMSLYNEAKSAMENKSFVLEADRVIFKRGVTAYVTSSTNFVAVEGDRATVQVAFNIPASGPNGIGGITVEGTPSSYKIKEDKKGNVTLTMSVSGVGISAQVTIRLTEGNNNATVDIYPNFNSNRMTLTGSLIPFENSRIFKGRSL